MESFLSAGVDHDRTKIIAVKKNTDMNPFGRLVVVNQFGGHLGDLLERLLKGLAVLFLEVEADAQGDGVSPKEERSGQKLVALDRSTRQGIFDPADGLHRLAAFGLFRVIQDEQERLARLGMQGLDQIGGFHGKGLGGGPAEQIEEIVESAAMGPIPLIEMSIEGGNITPPPCESHQEHEGFEIFGMVPVKEFFEGTKERIEFLRESDDLKHNGNLLSISTVTNLFIEEIAVFS